MKQLKVIGLGALLLLGVQGFAQDKNLDVPSEATKTEIKAETEKAEPAKLETTQTVKARVRTDWISSSVDTKTTGTVTTKNSGFRLHKLDLTFTNKLNDKATADVRITPVQANGEYAAQSTSASVPVSNLIEHAWLEYALGSFSFRAGKLDMAIGAVENIKVSSFDYYLTSYYYSYIPARQVGVSTFYKVAGQKLELQVTNGLPTDDTDINGKSVYATKGGTIVGLAYHGDFGMVKPIVSITKVGYAQPSHDSAGDGTKDIHGNSGRTMVGIGAVTTVAGSTLEYEYDTATIDTFKVQSGAVKTSIGKKQTLDSIVLSAKYPVGNLTPIAKITIDSHKKGAVSNVGDVAQTGVSLAAEYAVAKDARFHLAFNVIDKTTTKGAGTVDKKDSVTEIIAGAAVKI